MMLPGGINILDCFRSAGILNCASSTVMFYFSDHHVLFQLLKENFPHISQSLLAQFMLLILAHNGKHFFLRNDYDVNKII
mgnify:FL=1